jgi:hypothetical protein
MVAVESTAALVIALVALSVSIGGLAWELIVYRLAGARLRLEVTPGLFTHRGSIIRWNLRGWPREPTGVPGLREDDLWAEIAEVKVANAGRTVVWVSDLGLDFGRESRWRRRSRVVLTILPLAIGGGVGENSPIRLEPGQAASMYVPVLNSIAWGRKQSKSGRWRLFPSIARRKAESGQGRLLPSITRVPRESARRKASGSCERHIRRISDTTQPPSAKLAGQKGRWRIPALDGDERGP